jgi:hypothetical protein
MLGTIVYGRLRLIRKRLSTGREIVFPRLPIHRSQNIVAIRDPLHTRHISRQDKADTIS